MKKKKSLFRPFKKLRYNILSSRKILSFKKKSWGRARFFTKLKLKFFKRYKFRKQSFLRVSKLNRFETSYKNRFKKILNYKKVISSFYGGFRKKTFKKVFLQKNEGPTVNFFEQRLDSILTRSNFSSTIQSARQLILHGHIFVNGRVNKTISYKVKPLDFITVEKRIKFLVKTNVEQSIPFWPLPPKFLEINYKTLQIIILMKSKKEEFVLNYNINSSYIANVVKYY